MGNISRDTFDRIKHYVNVRLQQGVPVVDSDWNEAQDIRKDEIETFLKWFVGDGVPFGDNGFAIVAEGNDFSIADGLCLVKGRIAVNDWTKDENHDEPLRYSSQPLTDEALASIWGVDPLPPLTPPESSATDTVYLDVWEREVNAVEDPEIVNEVIGIETCVRTKREWAVRIWRESGELPEIRKDQEGREHYFYPLATLNWEGAGIGTITDLRRTRLTLAEKMDQPSGHQDMVTRVLRHRHYHGSRMADFTTPATISLHFESEIHVPERVKLYLRGAQKEDLPPGTVLEGGVGHSLALLAEEDQRPGHEQLKTLWARGRNEHGQLGLGDTTDSHSPVQVEAVYESWDGQQQAVTHWGAVAAGYRHNLAIFNSLPPSLYTWGFNGQGQLGLGDTENRSSPVQHDLALSALAAGDHSLAIRSDNRLLAWGPNSCGQLGLGDTTDRHSPTEVGDNSNWRGVAAGFCHSLALNREDFLRGATLWAWGLNTSGQLGLGDTDDRHSPVQVGTASDWVSVAAGYCHSIALRSDGTLWAWGSNNHGQLGLGDTDDRLSPVQVGSANDWFAVAAGLEHCLALRFDGTLWAWGSNGNGQLGLGNTTDSHFPLRIETASDWAAVGTGHDHGLALRSDGALSAWGRNSNGQLGLGDTEDRSSAEPVPQDSRPLPEVGQLRLKINGAEVTADLLALTDLDLLGNGSMRHPLMTRGIGLIDITSLIPLTVGTQEVCIEAPHSSLMLEYDLICE